MSARIFWTCASSMFTLWRIASYLLRSMWRLWAIFRASPSKNFEMFGWKSLFLHFWYRNCSQSQTTYSAYQTMS